ncbi:MAG: TonB-dependent siderophore receptor [Caulobacter sp.]|nr:TonB-dependent siderophore receptor [Caulobacter sp.]
MSCRATLFVTTILAFAPVLGVAHAEDEAPTTVAPVTVEGERRARSDGATGLDLTLRETPQSVTQISRQQIDDFALTNVNDLLSLVTGVNVERVETDRTYFNARGFDITNFQVDGVGLPLIWGIQFGDLDTALFERVDIIRGANGMLTGTGNPSATVNYIRKRPTAEVQALGSIAYGSWNDLRLEADLSGPLNAEGTVRGRLVYAGQDRDSHLDYNHVNRNVYYGVLSWDLTPRLTATAGYSRQENRSDGVLWGALPLTYSDGTRIKYDRSASTSADWTFWDVTDQSAFLETTYAFETGWRAKATYTHKTFEERARLLYAFGNPDPVTGLGVLAMSGVYPSKYEQDLFDATVSGPLSLLGRTHEVVLGVSAAEGTGREYENFFGSFPAYPAVQDWGRLQVAEPVYPGAYLAADTTDRLNRVYGAIHLDLADRLKAVVGFNAIDLTSSGVSYGADQARAESKVSPYLGAVFELTPNVSLYGSYTDIFNPQSEVDINRARLPAAQGKGWELGVKSEWFGGRLYATAAAFKSEQSDLAAYAGVIPGGSDSYYSGVDTFVEGYELEVSGAITDTWRVSGGWTQLSVEDQAGADVRDYLPRKTLKLATTYSIPDLRDLKLGLAARWQSAVSVVDLVRVEQEAYAVVDVMAGFAVTDRVRATVNVRNLFDETYLTSLMWNQSYFAAPRSASVRLDYRF